MSSELLITGRGPRLGSRSKSRDTSRSRSPTRTASRRHNMEEEEEKAQEPQSVSAPPGDILTSPEPEISSGPGTRLRSRSKWRDRPRSGSGSPERCASRRHNMEEEKSQEAEARNRKIAMACIKICCILFSELCEMGSKAGLGAPPSQALDSNNDEGDGREKGGQEEEEEEQEEDDSGNEKKEGRDLRPYLPLVRAAVAGDWEKASPHVDSIPDALTSPITVEGLTFLYLAVLWARPGRNARKRLNLLAKAVERMPAEALALGGKNGLTVLHVAAQAGYTPGVRILVQKNPALALLKDAHGRLPIHHAARMGQRVCYSHLLDAATRATDQAALPDMFAGTEGGDLVNALIRAESYDLALELVTRCPVLATARDQEGWSPLRVAALKSSSFESKQRRSFLQRLLYSRISVVEAEPRKGDLEDVSVSGEGSRMHPWPRKLGASCLISVPFIQHLRETKLMNHRMMLLVKYLCERTAELNHSRADKLFREAIELGAKKGNQEIIEEIVSIYPGAMNHNVFKIAVENRYENVFNLINRVSVFRESMRLARYEDMNHIWHVAARMAPAHRLQLISGGALQMQRELQWFKEVERLVGPHEKNMKNNKGKTADMIFAKEHAALVKEGEKWMKDTATSCSVVSALITTVVFAAALTVPGGNDQTTGHPIFANLAAFDIFMVFDALSLFSSTGSIIMFLSILTARYKQDDFLVALPRSLMIGLATLFVSMASMMVAFSVTLYLAVHHDNRAWIFTPLVVLGTLLVSLFGFLQLPLLKNVIISTYGPSTFRPNPDQLLPWE